MADKDYKVQVGVEATANTGALDKVNKGLDSLRQTARQVNDELGREETIDNLEEVADAATDAAGEAQHGQVDAEATADATDKSATQADAAEGPTPEEITERANEAYEEARCSGAVTMPVGWPAAPSRKASPAATPWNSSSATTTARPAR